jgi:hypothetical protein
MFDPSSYAQLGTSNMNTSIVLDQPANASLTNLDVVSGRVILRTSRPTDVESVLVKLEGESRSRLLSSPGPHGERPKPQMEYHKVCMSMISSGVAMNLIDIDVAIVQDPASLST